MSLIMNFGQLGDVTRISIRIYIRCMVCAVYGIIYTLKYTESVFVSNPSNLCETNTYDYPMISFLKTR